MKKSSTFFVVFKLYIQLLFTEKIITENLFAEQVFLCWDVFLQENKIFWNDITVNMCLKLCKDCVTSNKKKISENDIYPKGKENVSRKIVLHERHKKEMEKIASLETSKKRITLIYEIRKWSNEVRWAENNGNNFLLLQTRMQGSEEEFSTS